MKTTKIKRIAHSLPKRPVGTEELLKIAAELADQIQRADQPPVASLLSWRVRSVAALDDPDQNRGFIRACQIQRDAGALDSGEALFIIHRFASVIAEEIYETDAQLRRIGKAIEVVEKAHGLEDGEYWPIGEAPDDVEKLRTAWDRRADAILASVYQKLGEAGIATLPLADRASFMDRVKDGRRKWLEGEPKLEEAGPPRGLDM